MKIYSEGFIEEGAKGHLIKIRPDSNGPKIRTLAIGLSRDFRGVLPDRATIARIGEGKRFLMLFPEKVEDEDERYLVIAGFDRPGHRRSCSLHRERTTATILDSEEGYGAWGSGVAFIAILKEGEMIVSTSLQCIWMKDGEIKKAKMSEQEYLEWTGYLEMEEL